MSAPGRMRAGASGYPLQPYYFTFGQRWRHERHPTFPEAHPDGWVEARAVNELGAREIVVALIGRQWSMCYDEPPSEALFPLGRLALLGPQEGACDNCGASVMLSTAKGRFCGRSCADAYELR